jgi:hypothetical protein
VQVSSAQGQVYKVAQGATEFPEREFGNDSKSISPIIAAHSAKFNHFSSTLSSFWQN